MISAAPYPSRAISSLIVLDVGFPSIRDNCQNAKAGQLKREHN
jgi:hypothetical protein